MGGAWVAPQSRPQLSLGIYLFTGTAARSPLPAKGPEQC